MLSNVRWQEIEENPPVVELDFLHAISLLFSLTVNNVRTAVSAVPMVTTRGRKKPYTFSFNISPQRKEMIKLKVGIVKYDMLAIHFSL